LGGEDGGFFVVEKGEEGDLAQDIGAAGHGGSSGVVKSTERIA
jgi:hypothetical protein